jgi:hypothetical protein
MGGKGGYQGKQGHVPGGIQNRDGSAIAEGCHMRSRPYLIIALGGLMVLAMLPAQAASVPATFVGGSSNCSTVSSAAPFSLTISDPVTAGVYPLPGVSGAELTLFDVGRKSFSFSVSGAVIHDVIVKGSGSNWYDYDGAGAPVSSDTVLSIPNGNKLNLVHFCYSEAPAFSISGAKFEDSDADGTVDGGETGLPNWTIELYQGESLLSSTQTGTDGSYSFQVDAGNYQVCEVLQEGWVQTAPDGCHSVAVGPDATGVNFLNSEGIAICDGAATDLTEIVSASFTLIGDCGDDIKVVQLDIVGNEIVFIPRGSVAASFLGSLTFTKMQSDPLDDTALVLQYDPDDDGAEPFRVVPDCAGDEENPSLPVGDDTWCVVSASAEYLGDSLWSISWNVYGEGDPRFR